MSAVSSLMDRLLDLSNNSIQYGNSICPSMIRKLKVIVYFWQSFSSAKIQIVLLFIIKYQIVFSVTSIYQQETDRF